MIGQITNSVTLKNEYVPYIIKNNVKYIHWNPVEIEEGAVLYQCASVTPNASIDLIKSIIESDINSKVQENILSGYTYKNHKVYLSIENQMNYKSAYDLSVQTDGETLPVTFKFDDGQYIFETLEALKEFYLGMIEHILSCLKKGWELKESIDYNIYK